MEIICSNPCIFLSGRKGSGGREAFAFTKAVSSREGITEYIRGRHVTASICCNFSNKRRQTESGGQPHNVDIRTMYLLYEFYGATNCGEVGWLTRG